jgi:hypothetical protein
LLQVVDAYLSLLVRPKLLMLALPSQLDCKWNRAMDDESLKDWLYESVRLHTSFMLHVNFKIRRKSVHRMISITISFEPKYFSR